MRIGEFAKVCGTKISVLRHYDKLGLLRPVYIDRFTEYRYYDSTQIAVFERISELKAVGFSLSEIRRMLCDDSYAEEVFAGKREELLRQLHHLDELRDKLSGGITMEQNFKPLVEDLDIPFENDEQVIGKWLVVGGGEENSEPLIGDKNRHLYFLPGGAWYWCFGWTKGKFFYNGGYSRFANDYHLEQRGDDLYMVINFKTQDYPVTGETIPIALRKLDSVHYTAEQIVVRRDDINKPFRSDERVIGRWKAFCCFEPGQLPKEEFDPDESSPAFGRVYTGEMYLKSLEFKEGGHMSAVYGEELIEGDDMHVWTKGFWLRRWNSCACAYEIKEFDGKEYLIVEWKNGDYRWGGRETSYYVMVRE